MSAVRSVAVVGPMAAGKTTLIEELLAATGTIPRAGSVTAGTTVTDHDAEARRQQRSVAPAVASLVHRDVKINLIDTPGCPDFLGEVRAGLRAADAVLFVVGTADAADGVAAPTSALLAECRHAGVPAVLVLSRLDHARADEEAVSSIAESFGVDPQYIIWNNHHVTEDPDLLIIGADILIPSVNGVVYTVTLGDTLTDIATYYQIDVNTITAFLPNQLSSPDDVIEGMVLLLPGAVPPPPPPATRTPRGRSL